MDRAGIMASCADAFLFMTDDAVMGDEKVVSELFDSFNEDNVAVSYARQIANTESKFTEKLVREFNYPNYDIIKSKKTEKELGITFATIVTPYDIKLSVNDVVKRISDSKIFRVTSDSDDFKVPAISKGSVLYLFHA